MDPVCRCNMFVRLGTCWHTGYRPTFNPPVVREPVPRPELRRRAFLRLLEETRPNDPDVEA